jgi:hypothetical protein
VPTENEIKKSTICVLGDIDEVQERAWHTGCHDPSPGARAESERIGGMMNAGAEGREAHHAGGGDGRRSGKIFFSASNVKLRSAPHIITGGSDHVERD